MTDRCTDCQASQGRNCHCRTPRPHLYWPILIALFVWWYVIVGALHLWATIVELSP